MTLRFAFCVGVLGPSDLGGTKGIVKDVTPIRPGGLTCCIDPLNSKPRFNASMHQNFFSRSLDLGPLRLCFLLKFQVLNFWGPKFENDRLFLDIWIGFSTTMLHCIAPDWKSAKNLKNARLFYRRRFGKSLLAKIMPDSLAPTFSCARVGKCSTGNGARTDVNGFEIQISSQTLGSVYQCCAQYYASTTTTKCMDTIKIKV